MLYVLYSVLCYVTYGERTTWHALCNGILAFHAKRETCGLKLRLIHKQSATNAARWASRCVGRWAGLGLQPTRLPLRSPLVLALLLGFPTSLRLAQPSTKPTKHNFHHLRHATRKPQRKPKKLLDVPSHLSTPLPYGRGG